MGKQCLNGSEGYRAFLKDYGRDLVTCVSGRLSPLTLFDEHYDHFGFVALCLRDRTSEAGWRVRELERSSLASCLRVGQ